MTTESFPDFTRSADERCLAKLFHVQGPTPSGDDHFLVMQFYVLRVGDRRGVLTTVLLDLVLSLTKKHHGATIADSSC